MNTVLRPHALRVCHHDQLGARAAWALFVMVTRLLQYSVAELLMYVISGQSFGVVSDKMVLNFKVCIVLRISVKINHMRSTTELLQVP